jgi:GAF domain-containing protein
MITTSTVNNSIVLQNKQVMESYNKLKLSFSQLSEYALQKAESESVFVFRMSWAVITLIILTFGVISFYAYKILRRNEKLVTESARKLEQETHRVNTLSNFIEAVSTGDYSIEIESTDELSNKLISMRNTLRNNAEEDKRRNWATSGEAQIGEILRASGNIAELYDNIITFVVKYTKSNQGGLFLLNDENDQDHYIELVSCYAFERKKFIKKRVELGQGLIGQCYQEGARIHLREIPEGYVHITSGLGGANPTSLLIVPMKVNGKTYGVIELASFKKYEEHEIVLVEKFAESIGAEVSSVKVNESTRILLEKTQQQTEEMRAQEEEMRQNMEELEATQEEMRRKEKHIQNLLDEEVNRNQAAEKGRKAFVSLTKNKDIQSGNWQRALEVLTTTIAEQLQVSRCSVWSYDKKEHKIVSEKLYQASTHSFESGVELFGKDFPGYFSAVLREETILARDAHTHPATKEFSSVYLTPLNIESLFDVPIFNEGKIFGVICCEHQFEQKHLSDDQVEFLKSCSDLVTICYKTKRLNELSAELQGAKG